MREGKIYEVKMKQQKETGKGNRNQHQWEDFLIGNGENKKNGGRKINMRDKKE